MYTVIKKYSLKDIFQVIDVTWQKKKINLDWNLVNVNSIRLKCFKNFEKNLKCPTCWKEWHHFRLEYKEWVNDNKPHLNLYSEDWSLFTKDHIFPKSKWWTNHYTNLQVMCMECNIQKWNNVD